MSTTKHTSFHATVKQLAALLTAVDYDWNTGYRAALVEAGLVLVSGDTPVNSTTPAERNPPHNIGYASSHAPTDDNHKAP